MILKVKTWNGDKEGWLILGNVIDISYSDSVFEIDYDEINEMATLNDYCVFERPKDGKAKCNIIYFSDEHGNGQRKIWFNDITYIMNDEGKTVERVYGFQP